MKPALIDYLTKNGFVATDIEILFRRSHGILEVPTDIKVLLDSYGYDHNWDQAYAVQSAVTSCRGENLSCINAAILAYSLLGGFPEHPRVLLAIHRRDPQNVECGHVVALSEYHGKVYAFGKSNYSALNRVYGPYDNRTKVAKEFAKAYLSMRFTPLYFGFFDPQVFCQVEQLMSSPTSLNSLCDSMISNYQYAFDSQMENA
jgi:hypothetical protein